ncbi:CvpA family protein [Legionella spiritensis]|uniref:Colicin V n=1 Tax=Legionella spiritensis TaxID=452 RepID=A0A0W0Z4Q3_LEGSP|nr:CvpA family protein [Legionella spiritensis]KTD64124.1 colicin V [Legionella spiritensis]SNV37951.1 colicin V [Legionella spiritensis]
MQWYWVDLAIAAIIALSVLTGLIRGFVKELIALCIWILALWLAYRCNDMLNPWLQPYIQDNTVRKGAGFVLILMATLLVGAIINAIFSFIMKRTGLSGTDRMLGMAFGFIRGVFIVSLIILVVQMTSMPHEEYSRNSRLYSSFNPVVHWLNGLVPEFIKQAQIIDKQNGIIDISDQNDLELS